MPKRAPVFQAHKPTKAKDDRRPNSAGRGYGHRWRNARLLHLQQNPLCVECLGRGATEGASVVDHIVPHRGDYGLFWDECNWQSLCARCHNKKTALGE